MGWQEDRFISLLAHLGTRDRLTHGQAAATRNRTEAILAASDPGDPDDPAIWPRWARLMSHLLHADLAGDLRALGEADGNP